jgi:FlaA1/EpsC-like NDP-sugar epimerase
MVNSETVRYRRFLSPGNETGPRPRLAAAVARQTVLVTGAGGYIGSALAEAIAAAGAARVVLLDSAENSLFEIARRIEAAYGEVPREVILGSVTDAAMLDRVFSRFRPKTVYHAAAFKHVSLLEFNPLAALSNNALGTYTLAQAALRHGALALVLVSTDKAANPHSIMGASKRLAELTVAALGTSQCRMNAVRLANVIGSSGSVLPIFLDQIARRIPVTVTHPETSRYFMSLDEAVAAILAGGAAACSGRILLPEFGQPERIADIARFLIQQAAAAAEDTIPLRFIGLRPGEKIEEDLLFSTEIRDGSADGGLAVILTPCPTPAGVHDYMKRLSCLIDDADLMGVMETIAALVPEYQPSSVVLAAMGATERAVR